MHYLMPRLGSLVVRSAVIVSLALAILAAPFPAAAQPPSKEFRVGHLFGGGRTPDGRPPGPLREGLRELGYVEGRNVTYEARFAEGQANRLPGLAAELVRLKVDVTINTGSCITRAAQPSEVLVSSTAKDLVAGSGMTFTDRGTHLLKGLPGEWRLFSPDVLEARVSKNG